MKKTNINAINTPTARARKNNTVDEVFPTNDDEDDDDVDDETDGTEGGAKVELAIEST